MSKIVHMSSVHPALDVRIMLKECVSLAKAGYDVTFVVPHDKDEQYDGVTIKSIRRSQSGRLFRVFVTTWRVFLEAWRQKADLYHFHDPELMFAGVLLRLSGAKVIYDMHEDLPRQVLVKYWIPSMLRRPLSRLIEVLEYLISHLFLSANVAATPAIGQRFTSTNMSVIQNFPILAEFSKTNATTTYNERGKIVVYVGVIETIRGLSENVSAMDLVEHHDARLLLGGVMSPPAFAEDLKALNGWKRTEFKGWVDRKEVGILLNQARAGLVTLHPTLNYLVSYPVKMFEYMSVGLPVIASDFPLWRTIIEEHKCGVLVDPKDPKAIADAIDWIFDHPDEAEEMGRRGVKAVQEIYNWPIEEDKLVKLYKRLLA